MRVFGKQLAVSSKIFLLLLLTAHSLLLTQAGAAIVEVSAQRIGAATPGTASSQFLTFPNSVAIGDFIVVGGSMFGDTSAGVVFGAVETDCSSPLTAVSSISVSLFEITFIAYGFATSAGTCTVNAFPATGELAYITYGMTIFTGVNSTPLDVDSGHATANSTTPIRDITTVASGALIIGALSPVLTGGATITPDSNYTEIYEQENNSTNQASSVIFRIVSTPSTYSVLWNLSGGSVNWDVYAISFKPAAAPGGAIVRHRPIMQ